MKLFDVGMFEDVNYLLHQTGQTVKINHFPEPTPARIAHMADKIIYDNMSHFADKMIYVQHFMRRGHYILFDDQTWLQLHEINQPKYHTYIKGAIRQCNSCVKLIREYESRPRLYEIPAVSIGATDVPVSVGGMLRVTDNKMTVVVPHNTVTQTIEVNHRLILFGMGWKILSIDRSKRGVFVMDCEPSSTKEDIDDLELGIADRYVEGKDKLDGNTTPIPFMTMLKETYIEELDYAPECGGEGGEPEPEPEPTVEIGIDGYDGMLKGTEEYYTAVIKGTSEVFPGEVEWNIVVDSTQVIFTPLENNRVEVEVGMRYTGSHKFTLEVWEKGNEDNKDTMQISISKW